MTVRRILLVVLPTFLAASLFIDMPWWIVDPIAIACLIWCIGEAVSLGAYIERNRTQ